MLHERDWFDVFADFVNYPPLEASHDQILIWWGRALGILVIATGVVVAAGAVIAAK
jgi:hypothetical protein